MNRYTPLLMLLAACWSSAAVAQSPRIHTCTPKSWAVCADGDCQSDRGKMAIVLVAGEGSVPTVSRCDESGCTTLVVEVVESGVMLKAASAKSGYLLVINTLDGSFTEIATSVTTAFIKSGVCVR